MSARARETALGEIAALSLKAARGAGHDWGLAEEAADAVRCLQAHGLEGARLLVHVLEERPDPDPLRLGAELSDRADLLCADGPETLPALAAPALVLPFLSRAARVQSRALAVTGDGIDMICLPDGTLCGDVRPDTAPAALTIRPAGPPFPAPRPRVWRAQIAEADWDRLSGFAARTYAPATEASRLRGAGAAEDPES